MESDELDHVRVAEGRVHGLGEGVVVDGVATADDRLAQGTPRLVWRQRSPLRVARAGIGGSRLVRREAADATND